MNKDKLIIAGIIAGPLFIILALLQAFGREGFDIIRHPLSLLSLGDLGWIQISNFVIVGLLYIACASGLRMSELEGIGKTWIPHLFIVMGIGLIMGGIFVADPALGFPEGAPIGIPIEMSWHAAVHGIAPILAFLAQIGIFIIMTRRFKYYNETGLMIVTLSVTIITFILINIPNFTADWEQGIVNFMPMWIGAGIGYFYISYILIKLKNQILKM